MSCQADTSLPDRIFLILFAFYYFTDMNFFSTYNRVYRNMKNNIVENCAVWTEEISKVNTSQVTFTFSTEVHGRFWDFVEEINSFLDSIPPTRY